MSYVIGIYPSETWASTDIPPFRPGQRGKDDDGNEYLFVRADSGGVTQYYAAVVTSTAFVVDMIDTTNSAPGAQAGGIVCVPQVAIAASGYGWGLICGVGSVRTAASAAKGTLLNTTATAGQLDDDATAGAEVINGIALTAATGVAAAA
ncbi:hypothetical protein FK514_25070, partial [Klebsiella pneumoniae]|uniref:hypothetical protein n=1 Tax=Klebsiella pneumoniae TaxID=573 RepID=UPI00210CA882